MKELIARLINRNAEFRKNAKGKGKSSRMEKMWRKCQDKWESHGFLLLCLVRREKMGWARGKSKAA